MEIATFCKEFQVLPRAGGLFDQDYDTMQAIWYVVEAWREKDELDRKKAEAEAKRKKK